MTVTMGILRSHTSLHMPSHFTSHPRSSASTPPSKDQNDPLAAQDPVPGLSRSRTDPLDKKPTNTSKPSSPQSKTMTQATTPESNRSSASGTSSPRRMTSSLDIVRHIRENPTSHIPKYHVFAEHVHRYKMRHCQGMVATEEEQTKIKAMHKWNWKHAGRPGPAALPIGPRDETWDSKDEVFLQLKGLHLVDHDASEIEEGSPHAVPALSLLNREPTNKEEEDEQAYIRRLLKKKEEEENN